MLDYTNFYADQESIAQLHSVLIDSVIMKVNCMLLMGGSNISMENFIDEKSSLILICKTADNQQLKLS